MSNTATWTELIAWELTAKNAIADLSKILLATQAVLDLNDTKDGYHELEILRAVVKETEEKWRKP